MALDGIVIANLVFELNAALKEGRIVKIAQPEKDELLLTVKAGRIQRRLLISAGASLPLIYLTQENKTSPLTAPNFCMLLRKHLNSAKIISITQPELERVIDIEIEHLSEMGDILRKHLIVELMGKHSNLILSSREDGVMKVVDSIKHISSLVSSVREVLPGRDYFIPKTVEKLNPLSLTWEAFRDQLLPKPVPAGKALYTSLTGISPLIASEICFRASLDSDRPINALSEAEGLHLYKNLDRLVEEVREARFTPCLILDAEGSPVAFSSVLLTCYETAGYSCVRFDSVSALLESYYAVRDQVTRIRQKSADLRKVVSNCLDKARRKYDLQQKQLKDTQKREKYKVYGELINTYGYSLPEASSSLCCTNYYTNEEITIPLDPFVSPGENAKNYFERYNKLKRTFEAVTRQLEETKDEISHLESISNALDIAQKEEDLAAVKEELTQYGYIKRRHPAKPGEKKPKKTKLTSRPFHYLSSDGFHMYVGKNNFQNDELTFKFASGGDWWFHAKGMAGSHVVVKTEGGPLPDRTFNEAGSLAAYYSKGRDMDKVEVDYTEKKNVKKPGGAKPGFVVYYTNYSMMARPDINGLEQLP